MTAKATEPETEDEKPKDQKDQKDTKGTSGPEDEGFEPGGGTTGLGGGTA